MFKTNFAALDQSHWDYFNFYIIILNNSVANFIKAFVQVSIILIFTHEALVFSLMSSLISV